MNQILKSIVKIIKSCDSWQKSYGFINCMYNNYHMHFNYLVNPTKLKLNMIKINFDIRTKDKASWNNQLALFIIKVLEYYICFKT